MISLSAKTRKKFGKKTKALKSQGRVPAVVYGPKLKALAIDVDQKEFKKVFSQAGESSLIELAVDGEKTKNLVLVNDLQKDPVLNTVIHVDFFQPALDEEVEVTVPLVFEGVALAEKDLGGTLNKNISEIEIKALPQNLIHQITVSIEPLKTFEDHIYIKDLHVPSTVTILKKPEEIVASVLPPQKVEEELAEAIIENVEDVQKVEKKEKVEEVMEEPKE